MNIGNKSGLQNDRCDEYASFWQDPQLLGLEFLAARFIRHRYALHTHETYVLGVVEQGSASFWCGGQTHECPAGTIMLINPGEAHTGQASVRQGYRYEMLYPTVAFFSSALANDGQGQHWPSFPKHVIHDPPLVEAIRALHSAERTQTTVLQRQCLLTSVLGQLIERHGSSRPLRALKRTSRSRLLRVREMLEDRITENLSLSELACEAGLSPFHLLRIFEVNFGLPPHAYQRQSRVNRAKAMLRRGVKPIDAALLVGFSDQSHMTRWFKRTFGITPAQFSHAFSNIVQDNRRTFPAESGT